LTKETRSTLSETCHSATCSHNLHVVCPAMHIGETPIANTLYFAPL